MASRVTLLNSSAPAAAQSSSQVNDDDFSCYTSPQAHYQDQYVGMNQGGQSSMLVNPQVATDMMSQGYSAPHRKNVTFGDAQRQSVPVTKTQTSLPFMHHSRQDGCQGTGKIALNGTPWRSSAPAQQPPQAVNAGSAPKGKKKPKNTGTLQIPQGAGGDGQEYPVMSKEVPRSDFFEPDAMSGYISIKGIVEKLTPISAPLLSMRSVITFNDDGYLSNYAQDNMLQFPIQKLEVKSHYDWPDLGYDGTIHAYLWSMTNKFISSASAFMLIGRPSMATLNNIANAVRTSTLYGNGISFTIEQGTPLIFAFVAREPYCSVGQLVCLIQSKNNVAVKGENNCSYYLGEGKTHITIYG